MEPLFKAYKEIIDKRTAEFTTEISSWDLPWAKITAQQIAASTKRGKTVRGSLVLLILDLWHKPISPGAISAATALELVHSALLIHDDIMDHDDLRRGFPSAHKEYEKLGQSLGTADAADFGRSFAICAGDVAIFMAQWLLAREDKLPTHIKSELLSLLGREFLRVGFGQIQDLSFAQNPALPRPNEVLNMYRNKTARYTFSLPFLAGGLIAEAPAEALSDLDKAGEALGIIFQLTDDALTLKGDAAKVGKAIGNDISENKKTFYHVLLRQKASHQENQALDKIFGQPDPSAADIAFVRRLLTERGVEAEIETLLDAQSALAQQAIERLPLDASGKEKLIALNNYLRQREK